MIDVRVDVEDFNNLIFDKRELKRAIKAGGNLVLQEARRLISSRAISSAGGIPGLDSGTMKASIKTKVGSGGGYVRVMPYMTAKMRTATTSKQYKNGAFYPAFLFYGTSRGLKPRKDFMEVALSNKQFEIRGAIMASLQNAIREGF